MHPLFDKALNHDFSELSWLFKAILVRHHCVHRAGYDKGKNKVNVTTTSINDLLSSAINLADELNEL